MCLKQVLRYLVWHLCFKLVMRAKKKYERSQTLIKHIKQQYPLTESGLVYGPVN